MTVSRLKRWSIGFSGIVVAFTGVQLAVALLVLTGWQWDIGALQHPWPGLAVMNPVTAGTFMLSGLSLFLQTPRRRQAYWANAGFLLAVLVLLIAVLRMISVLWPDIWRVDFLLFSGRILSDMREHSISPRTMSPSSAITFSFSGFALLLLAFRRRSATIAAQSLAIAVGLIGLFTLICYVYGVKELDIPSVTLPMALHSTVCFVLLSLGILFATPGKGIMRPVTGPYTGSVMSRRFIPFALLVPAVFGWAALFSPWRDAVSIQLSAAVLVIGITLFSLAFIGYNTILLNHRDFAARQALQDFRAGEQRFRMLINGVRDYAIVMIDPGGRVRTWNEGAQAITGYTAREVMGQKMAVFYDRRDAEAGIPESNLRQAKEIGQFHREGWRPRKDGSRYWAEVTWTAVRDDFGRLQAYTVIVRDATERKRAQEKIAYQARLMEDSSDAVFSVDPEFRIVSFNKAAEALYGYTVAEVIGKPLNDVLRNQLHDAGRAGIRRELLEYGYWKGVVVFQTRDRGVLDISISVSRTSDEQGRIDGYIMVCRDMTERLKAEARLRKFNEELEHQVQEKTAALVRSNTELRALTTRLQLVREEERAVMAREIHDELGQQLTGLKMDLFWVARKLDAQAMKEAREKLHGTIGLLDDTIRIVRRIATDLRPSILDDLGLIAAIEWQSQEFEKRSGIRTAFRSSVNGMDFPPEMAIGMFRICQESLTNVARHAGASQVRITLDRVGGEVRMVVADNGKGIESEKADKARTLGLLGMKERALMMGGRLEIGNGEINGLQLVLTVPLPSVVT